MIIRSDETEDIAIPDGGTMRLHLFQPAIPGSFPGVLFFSEIYQVTDPIRRLAALVAGHGYVVGVPEVYHEYEAPGTVLAYDKPGTDRGNELKFAKPVARLRCRRHSRPRGAPHPSRLQRPARHPRRVPRRSTSPIAPRYRPTWRRPPASTPPTSIPGTLGQNSRETGKADDSLARMDELKAETLFVFGRQDPHVPFAGREAIRARARRGRRPLRVARGQRRPRLFARRGGRVTIPALFIEAMGWMLALFGRVL